MVYRPEEVANKVQRLLSDVETEVVEYKSAKNNFDFDDLGKYFSALSNEANLRHADAGWLLFGVRTIGRYVGLDTARKRMSQVSGCAS